MEMWIISLGIHLIFLQYFQQVKLFPSFENVTVTFVKDVSVAFYNLKYKLYMASYFFLEIYSKANLSLQTTH